MTLTPAQQQQVITHFYTKGPIWLDVLPQEFNLPKDVVARDVSTLWKAEGWMQEWWEERTNIRKTASKYWLAHWKVNAQPVVNLIQELLSTPS